MMKKTAFWIKKISWKNIIFVGSIYTAIALIAQQCESRFGINYPFTSSSVSYYANYHFINLIFTFVTGVSLAIVYYYLRDNLPKNKLQRTLYFADLMVATYFIFFTIPVFLIFSVSPMLLFIWFVKAFLLLLINSVVLVNIIK